MTLPLLDRALLPLRLARARRRGAYVAQHDLGAPHIVEAFDPRFDDGEAAYNALGAFDGAIHFAISTKSLDAGARLFRFDPDPSRLSTVADLGVELAHDERAIPHGKVHVDLAPIGNALYGATHIGYYDPRASLERPGSARGYALYPGGVFFALEGDTIHRLAQAPQGEGIITMVADAPRNMLYALTWPRGLFLSLDLATRTLRNHGPVLGLGEIGSKRHGTWTRICRSLGVDDLGHLYWSDAQGNIVRFDGDTIGVVARLPKAEMWRKVLWHPSECIFYGVLWSSAALFRFDPSSRTCDEIGSLRLSNGAATLAFTFDARARVIHACASGPGVLRDRDLPLASTVSHATFDLATHETHFSGPLRLTDGRWITQAQSLLLAGGFAYSLCWVEVPSGDRSSRARHIRALRRHTPEYRTRGYGEQMMLVRFNANRTDV